VLLYSEKLMSHLRAKTCHSISPQRKREPHRTRGIGLAIVITEILLITGRGDKAAVHEAPISVSNAEVRTKQSEDS